MTGPMTQEMTLRFSPLIASAAMSRGAYVGNKSETALIRVISSSSFHFENRVRTKPWNIGCAQLLPLQGKLGRQISGLIRLFEFTGAI